MKQPATIAPRGSGVYMKSVVFIDESWQEPEESESPRRHIILMTSGWDWEIDLPSRHIILMIALLVLIYSVLCVHFGDCGCANFFVLVYLSHFFSCDIRAKHDN
jgi:hypothetical protein